MSWENTRALEDMIAMANLSNIIVNLPEKMSGLINGIRDRICFEKLYNVDKEYPVLSFKNHQKVWRQSS